MRWNWRCRIIGEGINLLLADGEAAFQDVFHLHMHILPRFKGDLLKIDADWSIKPPREELDRLAAIIRSVYQSLWQGIHDGASSG